VTPQLWQALARLLRASAMWLIIGSVLYEKDRRPFIRLCVILLILQLWVLGVVLWAVRA
jgi:hypothetical protein